MRLWTLSSPARGQEAEFKRREAQRKLPPAEGPTEAPETRIAVLGKFGELSRSLRSDPAYQAAVDYAADSIKTQAEIMDAELNFRASIKSASNVIRLSIVISTPFCEATARNSC